jgi:hypothetical protein
LLTVVGVRRGEYDRSDAPAGAALRSDTSGSCASASANDEVVAAPGASPSASPSSLAPTASESPVDLGVVLCCTGLAARKGLDSLGGKAAPMPSEEVAGRSDPVDERMCRGVLMPDAELPDRDRGG